MTLTPSKGWVVGPLFLLLAACGSSGDAPLPAEAPTAPSAMQQFGFAGVDCGHDDPLDNAAVSDYLPEVAAFSSTAQVCVYAPDEPLQARLDKMAQRQVGAFLSVQAILFESAPDATVGGGTRVRLRADHAARWRQFVDGSGLRQRRTNLTAFYLVDEPTWHGVPASELRRAAELVKAEFPDVPVALIEAAPALASLQVPEAVDWIGFDHYAVPRPDTDPVYLGELALLKSKRSRAAQKVLLVMDAQWLPAYGQAGYSEADMKAVASRYAALAEHERADMAGMLGYLWPGGLDEPAQKGARDLPESVRQEYARIGRALTGKP